jgi:glycosyltransferase involved in cell wall biosynthesis
MNNLRVLIVAEHASLSYGGEAALPLHYFRVLRQRGIDTWLIVHERTREELVSLFEGDRDRIYFIADTIWHRWLWRCSQFVPKRIADFTFGLVLRLITQISQRRLAKKIVQQQEIDIIHQPILVSPKEPSMIFGMGAPVVIGPMNGGMQYPSGFCRDNALVNLGVETGRLVANLFNTLIPGKRQATTILVANQRTKASLPKGITGRIVEVVENGVDLAIWKPKGDRLIEPLNLAASIANPQPVRFVFVGRLVAWKAVDLLLKAFKYLSAQMPVELEIIGDGEQRSDLEALATALQLNSDYQTLVNFNGFLSQSACAQRLQSADVMVLPSLYECGGAVVLEAMTIGIPVIATDWGGPKDYLNDDCGILVEPKTPDLFVLGLANAMITLAESPELRQAMGRAGRQRIIDHFDWEVKVDRMLDIYQEAIARSALLSQFKDKEKLISC